MMRIDRDRHCLVFADGTEIPVEIVEPESEEIPVVFGVKGRGSLKPLDIEWIRLSDFGGDARIVLDLTTGKSTLVTDGPEV